MRSTSFLLGRFSVLVVLALQCALIPRSHAFTLRQASISRRATPGPLQVLQETNFVETSSLSLSGSTKASNGPAPRGTNPMDKSRRKPMNKPSPKMRHGVTQSRRSSSSSKPSSSASHRPSSSEVQLPTRGPWLATFGTSKQTQERLQLAGRIRGHALRRATHVLQTLLDQTPAEHANAANLVCALTLSAKLRGTTTTAMHEKMSSETKQLRRYLWRAIQVLRELNAKDQLSPRQICNAAWAVAKHYDRDPSLLPPPTSPGVEEWSWQQEKVMNEAQQAQMVDHVIDELALNLAHKLQHDPWIAKHGELCMACWAYGVLRERRRPAGWRLLPQVARAVTAPEKTQKTTDRSKTSQGAVAVRFEAWEGALGNEQHQEECLDFDPPGPTDLLLDQISLSLCQPVTPNSTVDGESTPLRLQMCRWRELSNFAWAHASHGWSCSGAAEGALLVLASEASQRLRNPSKGSEPPLSRDMAQLVWSLGILQADNFRLTSGLLQVLDGVANYTQFPNPTAERPFEAWSCPDIVQIPLALAHSRIDDQQLLRAMYSEATERIGAASRRGGEGRRNLHAWEIGILLWAQARLHLTEADGEIFADFPQIAIESLLDSAKYEGGWSAIGIGAQEQANLIWSLTVLEQFQDSRSIQLLRELFLVSQEECQETGVIQLEHAHQLWQALFLLEHEAPAAVKGVEPWFRDTLEAKWLQEKGRPKVSSARHRALSKVLSDMGVAHFNEHDEDIDVAIVLKRAASWTHETDRMSLDGGMRVAVEFDGPNHFTRILDTSKREAPRSLGHSILKYRLLKRQGWTVVRVPYYEFDRIPFWATMERQRYLQRLLKTHSDLKFSSVDVSEYKPPVANRQSRFQ